ncbi:hypothetical protein PWEIH_15198 [Listeria weihenstephanensis FSL R9-0317]|uniref:hypothetical protein n=1 Tax=Listeria weihenstephanensis TaxID=1006155 RepID=UPI0003E85235|nr:hypothetical protein [Listeria weihenstephanensis]EUJ35565.1 hypothetical protein PWEIH_15198 [Listeria weihenstephanensis FSL R9-0317]
MGSKKQALMERKEQLTAEKQAYLQTVEWVLAADKNVSEEDKEIFLLTTVDRLLEQESDAEAILGMDATTYARQITKQTADKVADKPIRIFVFAGFIIMSLYLIVMGIIDFFSKESTFYLGTFFCIIDLSRYLYRLYATRWLYLVETLFCDRIQVDGGILFDW